MLYEIKLSVTLPDADKATKLHYILDAETHGDAEATGYGLFPGTDVDVFAVFRSDIKEIVNDKTDDTNFYKATVTDIAIGDDGKERETKYRMLVCARDIMEATSLMERQMRQGYDMRLDGIARVRMEDYIKAS